MHFFVTLWLFVYFNEEVVEQRKSQGSRQGKVPGNEVLGDINGGTEHRKGTRDVRGLSLL